MNALVYCVPFEILFCYFSYSLQNQKKLEGILEKIVIEKSTFDPSQVSEQCVVGFMFLLMAPSV